jgi:hypothetical protein
MFVPGILGLPLSLRIVSGVADGFDTIGGVSGALFIFITVI